MTNKEVINFLNQVRKILLDDKSWLESTIQPINEAFDMAINALTAQQETHDKHTEMHACDCISRQAAIDAILEQTVCATKRELVERCDANISDEDGWLGGVCIALDTIEDLPSAQPDLSSYSDKLWHNAYERGRKDAVEEIIRCKDCKWGDWYTSVDRKRYCYCMETGNGGRTEDDFCSRAERREE